MEKNFIFIETISIFKKIFLSILLTLSVYLILFEGLFYGLIIFGISLRFLMQKGVELNLDAMKYRELYSWYGLRFGKWETLPKIDYVSIFKTKKGSRLRAGGGNAAHFITEIYKLNLFYNRNKHITLLESEDENKVFDAGNNISKLLNIKLHIPTKSE